MFFHGHFKNQPHFTTVLKTELQLLELYQSPRETLKSPFRSNVTVFSFFPHRVVFIKFVETVLVKMEAGKYTLPLHTTTEKLQLHLKRYNTQNHQKIKLCGSLTTKDLKKQHLSRWVGEAKS